ncbi:MAG TPA: phosphoribosylaminoimidazolesuccinocarboxamide synthase [Dermatophilaceae bacterium]|nr:phosphoribosylaminoimidazolesuccinocarboxamide synthase [Dermatophilaceae bacterium]
MSPPGPAPDLPGYRHVGSGKVRELYEPIDPATGAAATDRLLLVASDRISAFDHVLDSVIPDKGRLLTQLSLWWFEQLADLVPTHVIGTRVPDQVPPQVVGRAVMVRRLRMIPVECIGRAYLTGSGLSEYHRTGEVCGVRLPPGLTEASRLPEIIFTPTTKAELGRHDEPMTHAEVEALVGRQRSQLLAGLTTEVLTRGNALANARGILIADTKIEFGVDAAGHLVLADEVLTPDSSRFWPAQDWRPGRVQRSFDKQYVRDWLTSPASGWDRARGDPPPPLPEHVVAATREAYVIAYESLTGRRFA